MIGRLQPLLNSPPSLYLRVRDGAQRQSSCLAWDALNFQHCKIFFFLIFKLKSLASTGIWGHDNPLIKTAHCSFTSQLTTGETKIRPGQLLNLGSHTRSLLSSQIMQPSWEPRGRVAWRKDWSWVLHTQPTPTVSKIWQMSKPTPLAILLVKSW